MNDRDHRELASEGCGNMFRPSVNKNDAIDLPGGEGPRLVLGFQHVGALLGSVVMRDQGHVQRYGRTTHTGQVFVVRVKPDGLRKRQDIAELALF